MSNSVNKVLVIGAGSIGRRHIQCLKELGVPDVYVCEPVESNIQRVCASFDIRGIFSDFKSAIERHYDGVIICVPNHLHAEVAVPVIERGMPVLLEKPLEIDIEAAQTIQQAVHKHTTVLQVGYCMRFEGALTWIHDFLMSGRLGKMYSADVTVGQYLPDWRPGMDYSKVYSAIRSQGGGVCLDISHELDYFRWLFGEPFQIQSQTRRLSQLKINVEDIAEVLVYTQTGVLGRIHLDYLSRAVRRQLYVVAENGNLQYDFITNELKIFEAGGEFWQSRLFKEERNEQYKRQLKHFMQCAADDSKPLVDVDDALKTLEFALRIRESFKD